MNSNLDTPDYQVFTMYGVEPNFFEQVGEINPLNLVPFHELTFVQKVAILKAFCMNIFVSSIDIKI